MYPDLLETFCKVNLECFNNSSYRKAAEELLFKYIDKFLKAPFEQKKELKELVLLCLDAYKTFVKRQKEAMRVSEKLTPKLIEKRLAKPDLERLN